MLEDRIELCLLVTFGMHGDFQFTTWTKLNWWNSKI